MFITSQWRKIDRAAVMPSEQHLCLISIRVCRWCQTCFVSPAVAPACPGGLSWGRCRGGSGGVHNKERRRCPAPGCVPVAVFVPWQGWEMPWALGLWAGLGNTRAGIMGQPLPRCRPARSDARGPDALVPAPCLLFCSHLGPNLGGRGQQVPHGPPQGWQRCRHKTRGLRLLREPTAACPLHQSPQRGGEAQMRLEKPRGEAESVPVSLAARPPGRTMPREQGMVLVWMRD